MKTIEIDGSIGEGGGQILRTALSLSCITGHSLKLFNIRKGRKRPGLMHQHLACVNAASLISNAKVSGNDMGSTALLFSPGKIRAGNYLFDIKTAGSCSLVLQALLPPLLVADGTSTITIKGGTHVPFSPPYHYIAEVFVPVLNMMGIKIEPAIKMYGFYPNGGGEVRFRIHPVGKIIPIALSLRGDLQSILGYSGVANLPENIAARQRKSALQSLSPKSANIETVNVSSPGHGTFIFLKAQYANTLAGFSSLGKRGKPAEKVGDEAAAKFVAFNETTACTDPHLADQIVIYLGLAKEHSSFTTSRITQHLITNLRVIAEFMNIRYEIQGNLNSPGKVSITGNI